MQTMIKTHTSWKDSGYDCDHCGGEILLRTDRETGQPDRRCYQCQRCGCQWAENGDPLRVGTGPNCKAAQARRGGEALPPARQALSRRLWILLALVAGAALLRFGGVMMLRFLLPVLFLALIVFVVVRYGRQQLWW